MTEDRESFAPEPGSLLAISRLLQSAFMPIVSIFGGIVIRMYHDEHPPPHFHAGCQGMEAFVGIEDGEVIHGRLPRRAARILRSWALDRRQQLMANWICGEKLLPMEMIPGADDDD